MKKWFLIGGAIVIVIIIFLVWGVSNLGPLLKNAVNTYGPKITKTEMRLADVGVSIFSGEAKLKEFYLGNPKGFKSPDAIKVGSIYVDLDEGSLTGDTIIINKIEVVRPEITYEKARGTDNLQTILDNVRRTTGAGKPSKKESQKEGGGKKILIRDFILRDGKVNLAMSMLTGKSISAPLPDIHLKDVGKKKGGASPAEAFEQVFTALYEKITSRAVAEVLNQGLKALGPGMEAVGEGGKNTMEGVTEGAKKELEGATDKLKGLFGK
jgi:hypothetical protein